MKVSYHVYKDLEIKHAGTTDEEILHGSNKKDKARIRKLRYSFVCLGHHARRHKLFLGATNASGDLLVEFDRPTGFFGLLGVKYRLEEILGVKVDLVTRAGVHPALRDNILAEAVDAI